MNTKSVRILRGDSRTYPKTGQPPNQYSVHLAQNLWPILFEGRGYNTTRHAKKHFAITNYPKDNHYRNVTFQQDGAPPHIYANVEDL
jgi:hypothetical protein